MVHERINLPQDKLAAFCRRWQITELALFGSAERAAFRSESGVDFRILYIIEGQELVVTVVKVGHRQDVYR